MLLPIKMQLPYLLPDWEQARTRALTHWAEGLIRLMWLADDRGNPARPEAHSLAIDLMPQVCHVLLELAELGDQGADCLCSLLNEAANHYQYDLSSLSVLLNVSEHDILADRPLFRGIAYRCAGDLLSRLGEEDEALVQYRNACSLYRKEQAPVGLCYTLAELYRIFSQTGQRTEAEPIRRELEKLLPGVSADVQEYVNGILTAAQPRGGFLKRILGTLRRIFTT